MNESAALNHCSAPTDELTQYPHAPVENSTITAQLRHRSIRKFTDEKIEPKVLESLFEVARHTATSTFMQQFTIIHITDKNLRDEFASLTGQPYVGGPNGELLIFIVDLHRNAQIRRELQADLAPLERMNLFLTGAQDTLLAAQNLMVAAESLGLGGVYLGSITNDPERVIELLNLPKYTYPMVGMLLGHPDQEPQFKPRLPLKFTVSENTYPAQNNLVEQLAEYDAEVGAYYDLRDLTKPLTSFTSRVAQLLGTGKAENSPVLEVLKRQGLAQR